MTEDKKETKEETKKENVSKKPEETKEIPNFIVKGDVLNAMLQYLAQKPYGEVHQMISAISQSQPIVKQ
jgi:hypothetical protein